jgi:hypothetical protein
MLCKVTVPIIASSSGAGLRGAAPIHGVLVRIEPRGAG